MELLKDILSVIIYAVITGAGAIIVKKVLDRLNASIDNIQVNTKLAEYEKLNKIIDQVQSVVATIVQSVNQTFVDSLKQSGIFTKESAIEAKNMALDMADTLLTEEAINAIEQVYGDVDVYLDSLIETLVKELKK
jgi:hypothetical protein